MVEVIEKKSARSKKIPANLVRETLRGKPLYYKGYKNVLDGTKKLEEIMGSSSLQAYLVGLICATLFQLINRKKYILTTNETGLHLDKNNNFSTDIGIFLKEQLPLNDKYFAIAPEIDVKIDTEKELDYLFAKSEELINFGVEQIIWIMTKHQKVFLLKKNQPTIIYTWNDDIVVLENVSFNLNKLLAEEGITL